MEASKLKLIAEGMGYEYRQYASIESSKNMFAKDMAIEEYNPLTNDTQCMEIMEKLPVDISKQSTQTVGKPETEKSYWMAGARYFNKKGEFVRVLEEGKTIKEAVCNAAYEYFKENKQ